MCDECGCDERSIMIEKSVTGFNDAIAVGLKHQLSTLNVFCINIMGSPGAGKTTIIEGLLPHLKHTAIIQGDLESDIDKKRLDKYGCQVVQINTHSGCHLNAAMIKDAVSKIRLEGIEYLIIENVGNLVCPAQIKIGQHMNLTVSSTAEGDDKPLKYPYIFRDSKIIVISKIDLEPHVCFDRERYLGALKKIHPSGKVLFTGIKDKNGFSELAHVLAHQREHEFNIAH